MANTVTLNRTADAAPTAKVVVQAVGFVVAAVASAVATGEVNLPELLVLGAGALSSVTAYLKQDSIDIDDLVDAYQELEGLPEVRGPLA